jgi:hypothetical protein
MQATAAPTVTAGGTGYTVGDTLTVVGGTFTTAVSLTVATISSGVVTSVTLAGTGAYTILPTYPASVTGGTGTGATFTFSTWSLSTTVANITNAGSGYVEQPTVTFSGGGGSGAAAYATVGSIPTVKSVGAGISFATPSGEQFRVKDNTTTAVNYGTIKGSGSGSTVDFGVDGSDGGITLALKSKGSGGIFLYTAGGNNAQFGVTHTASAVNYVQVTGAATGASPTISSQGSDSNPNITLQSKGTGNVVLMDGGGNTGVRLLRAAASGDTFVDVQRNVGFIDFIASSGVTDGDIRFTPKGAGNVRFGTYTATVTAVAGYITIKDAGGTLRKLAVLT